MVARELQTWYLFSGDQSRLTGFPLQKQNPASHQVRDGLEKFYPRLWRYCLTLTGARDRADDLVQAASLRALEKADKFQPDSHIDRWLLRLTQRIWYNEVRSSAVRATEGFPEFEGMEFADQSQNPENKVWGRQVLNGVMALPEAQRSVVVLVYAEGYSYRDAADILDIPIGTVMSRLSAARLKLSEQYGQKSEGK